MTQFPCVAFSQGARHSGDPHAGRCRHRRQPGGSRVSQACAGRRRHRLQVRRAGWTPRRQKLCRGLPRLQPGFRQRTEVFLPPPRSCRLVTHAAKPFASSGAASAGGTFGSETRTGGLRRPGPSCADGHRCAVNKRQEKRTAKPARVHLFAGLASHAASHAEQGRGERSCPDLAAGFERRRRGRAPTAWLAPASL